MPRKSTIDERLLIDAQPANYRDRVYIKELAWYLHQGAHSLKRFAKKHGFLRQVRLGSGGQEAVTYVSAYAALRMIAHFRAYQVAISAKRYKDIHIAVERARTYQIRRRAALKAGRAP